MIVPIQKWGIGDIIFEQTLVRSFGEPIWWPVEQRFLEGLQRAYPDINFTIDDFHTKIAGYDDMRKEDYYYSELHFLPLRWADVMLNVPYTDCMKAKYMLYQMDWQNWKQQAMWQRDTERENELQAFLGIRTGEPYNLINKTFRTNGSGKAAVSVENGHRNIEMTTIPGFSLFDWAAVLENATEIHTVSTSIIYILELLTLKAKEVHLYVRAPDEVDFRNIEYLLTSHKYVQHL